jgi:para-aminobenzoate synthetase component 1
VAELLELHEPRGAFARIERWLQDHGFFAPGGEAMVADLFLGYGLSEELRRGQTPAPPEPCAALPLAACRIRQEEPEVGSRRRYRVGYWERTWTSAEYGAAVEEVRAAIARGDVYQVNLVQHLAAPFAGDPRSLAVALSGLRPIQPASFATDEWAVVSGSPERFLSRRGSRLWTEPIKGTRPLGGGAELRSSEKDAAEHVMIVDLERNDLSRVCEPGSVCWPELMSTRALAGVEHLVSTVEGTLRDGAGLAEILQATFPGGSVTGAPKIAAVDLIADLEPVGRGASMGAFGRIYGNGDFDLALTIRTFAIAEGEIHLWVGGGVVWDSDAAEEIDESWTKAGPLLEAIGASLPQVAAR